MYISVTQYLTTTKVPLPWHRSTQNYPRIYQDCGSNQVTCYWPNAAIVNWYYWRYYTAHLVSLPSGVLENTTRTSPHHLAEQRPTGSETSQPYTSRSSGYGSEPPCRGCCQCMTQRNLWVACQKRTRRHINTEWPHENKKLLNFSLYMSYISQRSTDFFYGSVLNIAMSPMDYDELRQFAELQNYELCVLNTQITTSP